MQERRLGSRYVLVEALGWGAMGEVFRARVEPGPGDPAERPADVAVKLLRDGLGDDPDHVRRFLTEGRLLKTVDHPNVVRIRDLVAEGDQLAIVMDLMADGDLRRAVPTPCPEPRAAEIVVAIADGLAAVHAAGITHRDLKPENVLVERAPDGTVRPRISDFGVSRFDSSTLSNTKGMTGTVGYIAPEVAEGRPAIPASDVYSLGVILYELCAGHPPFEADNPIAVIRAHAQDAVPRPPAMSTPMWELVESLLSKTPTRRPTAAQTATRLRRLTPGRPEPGSLEPGASAGVARAAAEAAPATLAASVPAPATLHDVPSTLHDTVTAQPPAPATPPPAPATLSPAPAEPPAPAPAAPVIPPAPAAGIPPAPAAGIPPVPAAGIPPVPTTWSTPAVPSAPEPRSMPPANIPVPRSTPVPDHTSLPPVPGMPLPPGRSRRRSPLLYMLSGLAVLLLVGGVTWISWSVMGGRPSGDVGLAGHAGDGQVPPSASDDPAARSASGSSGKPAGPAVTSSSSPGSTSPATSLPYRTATPIAPGVRPAAPSASPAAHRTTPGAALTRTVTATVKGATTGRATPGAATSAAGAAAPAPVTTHTVTATASAPAAPPSTSADPRKGSVPLYRYYSSANGDHFYTTNHGELGDGGKGYKAEGVAGYVFKDPKSGTVPLYRYYNGSNGDHFYTTNYGELGGGGKGYKAEGIAAYVYPSPVSGTVPLYRYVNGTLGDHFYTTNYGELGGGSKGYRFEGIAGYVFG